MSRNPAKTLELFFAIDQSVIDRDIARAAIDRTKAGRKMKSLTAIPYKAKTPEVEARIAHLSMVAATMLSNKVGVPNELKVFYAAFGAGHVVQDAEVIAWDKGTLAELTARMDAIRKREGLADDEFWIERDSGPQDYRELNEEFSRLAKRIEDTVFVFVLRRYGLDEQAGLFERDGVEFEIQREIGRRVASILRDPASLEPDDLESDFDSFMDDVILRQYGTHALERVRRRAKHLADRLRNSNRR